MSYVRNITIRTVKSHPLLTPTQIVLTFTPIDQTGIFKDIMPIAWQVMTFAANQESEATAIWTPSYGFSVIQYAGGNMITAGASTMAGAGQTVTLTGNDNVGLSWSPPASHANPDTMIADNASGTPKDFTIGLVSRTSPLKVDPVLVFPATPSGNNLVARPTPVLHAFSTQNYKKNSVLEAAVQGSALLGVDGVNVVSLPTDTYYRLYTHPVTGAATLVRDVAR